MEQYRISRDKGLEFGIFTLGDHVPNPLTGSRISAQQRIQEIIELSQLAEQAGVDVFGVGESHQQYFTTQAHSVVLGAIAQATSTIKLMSSATVLSVADPVRVYEDFATLDLISNGRAEIVAGRGSRVGAHELFGVSLRDYEAIFEDKLALLKQLNDNEIVSYNGKFRPPLKDAHILPQPLNGSMPIWRAVGGPPESAIKAGQMGIPMMLAALGGPSIAFATSVDAYRQAAADSGHDPSQLPVATTAIFYVAETEQQALEGMFPHLNAGMTAIRGQGYPRAQFEASTAVDQALMVGSTQQIIEKLHYQYELFGSQRFMAQMDFGGVPHDKLMKNIEIIGNDIIPAVKKFSSK